MPETIEEAKKYLKRLHRLLTSGLSEGQPDIVMLFKMLAMYEMYPDNANIRDHIINEARERYQVIGEDTEQYEFNME